MSAHRWTGADVTSTARPRRPITSQQTCLPVCSSCVSMFTQRKLCVKTWACWCGHVFVSGAGSVHQQSAASPGPGGLAALYRWLTWTLTCHLTCHLTVCKGWKDSSEVFFFVQNISGCFSVFSCSDERSDRKHLNCPSGSAPLITNCHNLKFVFVNVNMSRSSSACWLL